MCPPCIVKEIWGLKGNKVTTLTFWGHVTSLITWPSDSAWALSHWWLMLTMRLPSTVIEIRGLKDLWVMSLTFWGHVTTGLGICGFLLVVHWNHASILHRYRDMKPQSCIAFALIKSQKFTAHASCHVTCRQGSKMTTYLEFSRPYCPFTIQLLRAYDDD